LKTSLGQKRCDKYLQRFKYTKSNDIRFVDPDIFDDHLLENDDIKMDILDKKLFVREIEQYKVQCNAFEKVLDELNMKQKYLLNFVNRGIATRWSYKHHITSPQQLEEIIKNKMDAAVIWNEFGIDDKTNVNPLQKYKSYGDLRAYRKLKDVNSGYMSDPTHGNTDDEDEDDVGSYDSDLLYNQTGKDTAKASVDGTHTKGQLIEEFNSQIKM